MYIWYLKILLSNGKTVYGAYQCNAGNSTDAIKQIFDDRFSAVVFMTPDKSRETALCVIIRDISAYWISSKQFEDDKEKQ